MKKANFNAIMNLPIPESWVENALAIPERKEKKAVPFWRSRAMIAAASLVLVSALSILLYLSFGMKPPVEVKPYTHAASTVRPTYESGETAVTQTVTDGTTGMNETRPAEAEPESVQAIDRISGTVYVSPTATAPQSGTTPSPYPSAKPTTPGTKPNPTEAVQPTDRPYVPPTEEAQPTEPSWNTPTEQPWEPGWDYPTELPTENTDEPHNPPAKLPKRRILYASIPKDIIPSDGTVFCMLRTDDGAALGDYGEFSADRRMTLLAYGTKYTYYYTVSDYISVPYEAENTTVSYEIYDGEGNILTTGSYRL